MINYKYEGKNEEEVLEKAVKELKVQENDLIIKKIDKKGGFLKGKKIEAIVIKKDDVVNYIKEYLNQTLTLMGIKANIEVKKRDDNIKILLSSNQNSILIGKEGKTIEAFQIILNQIIYNNIGAYFRISVDVGEYKLKKQKKLEIKIRKIAYSVSCSKVSAKLDPMNSYERRIVHTVLSEYNGVATTSEGEEPNRYVVIKPKE
ncbi:MAG: RNA-binding cell elongation regulator Jag/EloR [Bacilli bacterium]